MSRTLHHWHDKSSARTFCTVCGCDRAVTHPDDVANLAAGKPLFWSKPKYTRAGKDYQSRGYSPKGSPRGQGYCDLTWPAGWMPEHAPPHGNLKACDVNAELAKAYAVKVELVVDPDASPGDAHFGRHVNSIGKVYEMLSKSASVGGTEATNNALRYALHQRGLI